MVDHGQLADLMVDHGQLADLMGKKELLLKQTDICHGLLNVNSGLQCRRKWKELILVEIDVTAVNAKEHCGGGLFCG